MPRFPRVISAALAADPAHAYAEAVATGEIIANQYIIQAAKRHLRDAGRRDIYWCAESAAKVRAFLTGCVKVNSGDGSGPKALELMPWQEFTFIPVFAWRMSGDNDRLLRERHSLRYRHLILVGPKGIGKTPVIAGCISFIFTNANDLNNNLYIVAKTKERGERISIRPIRRILQGMAKDGHIRWKLASEVGNKRVPPCTVVYHKSDHRLVYYDSSGWDRATIEVLSPGKQGDTDNFEGLEVTAAVLSEQQEWTSSAPLTVMISSQKTKRDVLFFRDMNTSEFKEGPAWEDQCRAVSALKSRPGCRGDDEHGVIFCIDERDKPFEDRSCWVKANPSLEHGIQRPATILAAINAAQTPVDQERVKQLHFGISMDGTFLVLDLATWAEAQVTRIEPHPDAKLFIGLDLAREDAMAAATELWAWRPKNMPSTKTLFWYRVFYWWCEASLRRQTDEDRTNFLKWQESGGNLHIEPGGEVNFDAIAAWLEQRKNALACAYDDYRMREITVRLNDLNVPWHDALKKEKGRSGMAFYRHPQGSAQVRNNPLYMGESYRIFKSVFVSRRAKVEENPVMTYNMTIPTLAHDKLRNPYYCRPPAGKYIDGLTTSTQATGVADYIINPTGKKKGFGFKVRK